ncbi:MAG: SLBB domain-containing protein [Gammaproteobacteria bacterium]|jgi:Na+-translocating ferredoxin:NAD+ oxidoreductase RnfC subunit
MPKTAEQIVQAVKNAGVIGAGGGGFPTHVKLQTKVDTIIANGSECEPLLASDRTMMVQKPELLIEGMQHAMRATSAKQGIIALKAHYHDAIDAIKKHLPADGSIKLHLLDNYYPAGDEFLLVYEVTGKIIPEGGIPLNVGIVVNNVITLMQIAHAVNGKPVTERAVTLIGEFREPKIVIVPIGTTYNDLIKLAGGLNISDAVLIDGGPMMGKIVDDWNQGIGKTTSGVIALPKNHLLIRKAKKSLEQIIKQTKSACCQCFRCTDLCPRNLLGHELYPHMTMRTVAYNNAEPTKHITSAFLCSQCGMCELIACDFMHLSPRKVFAAYKNELISRGVKSPHKNVPAKTNSQFKNRKPSIQMVIKKLNLEKYNCKPVFAGIQQTKMVRIPLSKHIGTPAISQVNLGQMVHRCDIIAATPQDELGAVYHASIDGKVTEIGNDYIEISG